MLWLSTIIAGLFVVRELIEFRREMKHDRDFWSRYGVD